MSDLVSDLLSAHFLSHSEVHNGSSGATCEEGSLATCGSPAAPARPVLFLARAVGDTGVTVWLCIARITVTKGRQWASTHLCAPVRCPQSTDVNWWNGYVATGVFPGLAHDDTSNAVRYAISVYWVMQTMMAVGCVTMSLCTCCRSECMLPSTMPPMPLHPFTPFTSTCPLPVFLHVAPRAFVRLRVKLRLPSLPFAHVYMFIASIYLRVFATGTVTSTHALPRSASSPCSWSCREVWY